MIEIIQAETDKQVADAKGLFVEYAESLRFSLCFQNFDEELARLPGEYAQPSGRLLIAYDGGVPMGCVALHKLDSMICEMKRLYVKPIARGKKIGKLLADRIIEEATEIGYTHMRLDTVPERMQAAVAMYRAQGFYEIEPYRYNPEAGALYMEKVLK
jgi:ribosomal protein S18 acetylase RimI-like enzyme